MQILTTSIPLSNSRDGGRGRVHFKKSLSLPDFTYITNQVYNILGEQVLTETLRSAQGDNVININSQPNGIYFYRVVSENGNLVGEGKIVIEK